MNNWKSNTNKKPGLEYIPSVYNNPFMVDLYRAMKEKLKVCTNQSQSLDSIAKELGFITKANNYQIFFMGGLLVNAKKKLPYGEFGPWIEKNVPFSERTAHKYMKIYKVCFGLPELLGYESRAVLEVLCDKKCPDDLRKKLADILPSAYSINLKKLHELIKEYNESDFDTDSPRIQLYLMEKDQETYDYNSRREVQGFIALLEKKLESLSSQAPPISYNQLLDYDISIHSILPEFKKMTYEYIQKLRVLAEDYELFLSQDKKEYLSSNIDKLKDRIVLKQRREWEQEVIEIAIVEDKYLQLKRDYERSADYAPEDGDEPFEKYCQKRLNQPSQVNLVDEDNERFPKWISERPKRLLRGSKSIRNCRSSVSS